MGGLLSRSVAGLLVALICLSCSIRSMFHDSLGWKLYEATIERGRAEPETGALIS